MGMWGWEWACAGQPEVPPGAAGGALGGPCRGQQAASRAPGLAREAGGLQTPEGVACREPLALPALPRHARVPQLSTGRATGRGSQSVPRPALSASPGPLRPERQAGHSCWCPSVQPSRRPSKQCGNTGSAWDFWGVPAGEGGGAGTAGAPHSGEPSLLPRCSPPPSRLSQSVRRPGSREPVGSICGSRCRGVSSPLLPCAPAAPVSTCSARRPLLGPLNSGRPLGCQEPRWVRQTQGELGQRLLCQADFNPEATPNREGGGQDAGSAAGLELTSDHDRARHCCLTWFSSRPQPLLFPASVLL